MVWYMVLRKLHRFVTLNVDIDFRFWIYYPLTYHC